MDEEFERLVGCVASVETIFDEVARLTPKLFRFKDRYRMGVWWREYEFVDRFRDLLDLMLKLCDSIDADKVVACDEDVCFDADLYIDEDMGVVHRLYEFIDTLR